MKSKLLTIGISGFLLISIMFTVHIYKDSVQSSMGFYNGNNVQMTLDILKTVNDYSNISVLNEKICSNSKITNPTDKRGNETLIYYSRKFIRNEMVYHQDYDYNISNILLGNNRHFVGKKGYTKGKGFYPYPPSVSVLVVDDIKLSELDKEKLLYGLNSYNKGVVVALVFSDGFYIYQVDNKGNKINECEFSCSNNVKLIEEMTPEFAREAIIIKYKCNKDSVKHFSVDQQGYYWFDYYENDSKRTILLVNPKNGNVYKNLSKEVSFNVYYIE